MIDVYVTNPDNGRRLWLTLPATKDQMRELLAKIGVDGVTHREYTITEYRVGLFGIAGLKDREDIDELNYLASLLDNMSFEEIDGFEAAALHGQYTGSVKDLINLAQNPDCYEYAPGVGTHEELGRHLIDVLERDKIPGTIEPYFNYGAYGKDFAASKGGIFAATGFAYRNDTVFTEYYNGRDVPEEYRIFALPAPPEKMPIKNQLDMYEKMAGAAPGNHRDAPGRDDHADR